MNRKLGSAVAVTALWALVTAPVVAGEPGVSDAQGTAVTNNYQIGDGSVTSATVSAQPGTEGSAANYALKFTAPSGLAKGSTITITDPSGSTVFPSAAGDYSIIDNTSASGDQSPSAVHLASGDHSVTLTLSAPVAARSVLTVNLTGVTNPAKVGNYSLDVSTSANPGPATTATYQILPAGPTFTATAAPALVGNSSVYTVGTVKAASDLAAGDLIDIVSSANSGTSDNVGFPTAASDYKVDDVTTGHTSAPSAVTISGTGSSATGETVTLKLSNAVSSGDELSVTVNGVHNPTAGQTDTISMAAPSTAKAATTDLVVGTSVASPAVRLSNRAGGATGVEYTLTFGVTTQMAANGTVTVTAPDGTNFASASVDLVDASHPSQSLKLAAASLKASSSGASTTDNVLTITVPNVLYAGDRVSLDISGVVNPSAGNYGGAAGDFTVATGSDAIPAVVGAYTVTAPAAPAMATISVSPSTPVTVARYALGDLKATANLAAGSSSLELKAPAGTVFPSSVADYELTDLTHNFGSARPASLSGGGSDDVVLKLGATIGSGDAFDVTVDDVLNPGAGTYQMDIVGNVEAAAPPPPPAATVTTRTTLSVEPDPALVGAKVTLTATVTPPTNVGTISFTDNGKPLTGCTAVVVRDSRASCQTVYGSSGSNSLEATYNGASDIRSSASVNTGLEVTNVAKLSLSTSHNPALIGETVTYTATVVPAASRGTVEFTQDGSVLPGCGAVDVVNGHASCAVTFWAGGSHTVTARYSGTKGVAPAKSAATDESVSFPAAGYWLATSQGQVYGLGGAASMGGAPVSGATGPVVGMANTPSGHGYWLVTSDGTVTARGDAHYYGDLPAMRVHAKDIVAIAPTADGHGYWLVGRDGGMFAFGDAHFHGSIPGLGLHVKDVVGMVSSTNGKGYLLVGTDGGVFSFGSARFHGSLPGLGKHVHDIRAILPSSTGGGYVLVGSDGGAFVFGTGVHFMGSLPGRGVKVNDIVGIALTPEDNGYYMAATDGRVYGFGAATPYPVPAALSHTTAVVAIAGT